MLSAPFVLLGAYVFLPVINVDLNAIFIFNWSVWLLKKWDWKQEFDAVGFKL